MTRYATVERLRVLAPADYYLPGYKGGGPITTLANMVERLGDEIDFRILTRDRDLGDSSAYPVAAQADEALRVGRAEVRYLSPAAAGRDVMLDELRQADYDVLYLNSLYSPAYSIRPLAWMRLGRVPQRPVVLAPRGELALGARRIKRLKKSAFLTGSRLLGLHSDVTWQASSEYEADDIRRVFGRRVRVALAPDLTTKGTPASRSVESATARSIGKRPGTLRLLFVGRVCRMKNLRFAVEALERLSGDVELHVIGPIEEPAYWEECRAVAGSLPASVRMTYGGTRSPHEVQAAMPAYDFLVLPSHGENFGHVVAEAMSVGTPVVISDRTPWRGLQPTSAGWDLPLDNVGAFRETFARCLELDEPQHAVMRRAAWNYWKTRMACDDEVVEQNRRLFFDACSRSSRTPAPVAA